MKNLRVLSVFCLLFYAVSLSGQISNNGKTISLSPKSSTFLNAKNDTISSTEYSSLLNSGLFITSFSVSGDSHYTIRLDSTELVKLVGCQSPVLEFGLHNGKKIILDQKNIYVIVFWGTGCKPCVREMDDLIQASHKNKMVKYLFITNDDEPKAIGFLKERIRLINLVTSASVMAKSFRVDNLPTTFFIARGKMIRHIVVGPVVNKINDLIKELAD
jgi:thiol-disulfide isomerase/thioredoxin